MALHVVGNMECFIQAMCCDSLVKKKSIPPPNRTVSNSDKHGTIWGQCVISLIHDNDKHRNYTKTQ